MGFVRLSTRVVVATFLVTGVLSVAGVGATDERDAAARVPVRATSCLECHGELVQGAPSHHTFEERRCVLCHVPRAPGEHDFQSDSRGAEERCAGCHVFRRADAVHAPVRDGSCLGCHRAHAPAADPARNALLRAPTERELCATCHARQAGVDLAYVHGPVEAVPCSLCHAGHASHAPHEPPPGAEPSCADCHQETIEALDRAASVHLPVEADCQLCHDAHASAHPFQLTREPDALCADCHGPLLREFAVQPVRHAALDTGEGCAHCHDAHAAGLPELLRKPVGELCLDCHTEALPGAGGREVPGMGDRLEAAANLHGPVADRACDACHDPHGAGTFDLLREPYPEGFYAPFDVDTYGLCFRCHSQEAFTEAETTTHTRFRDGTRNLHWLHVNREKGRTCRACHETHASDLPFHMSKEVPFGGWSLPVGFEERVGGGSCAPGCHAPMEYRYDGERPEPEPRARRAGGGERDR